MCCSNGSLFHKKSLNMGPIFYKNIPKHGWTPENVKNEPRYQEKAVKMGTFFCQSDPYTWVWVSRLVRQTAVQTKSEYPMMPTQALKTWVLHIMGGYL